MAIYQLWPYISYACETTSRAVGLCAQVLSSLRGAADAAPRHCLVYYCLTADTVAALAPAPGPDGISLLLRLVREEISALASPPCSRASADVRLHGRLLLLRALWFALLDHRASLPYNAMTTLVDTSTLDTFLDVLLFPEAKVRPRLPRPA